MIEEELKPLKSKRDIISYLIFGIFIIMFIVIFMICNKAEEFTTTAKILGISSLVIILVLSGIMAELTEKIKLEKKRIEKTKQQEKDLLETQKVSMIVNQVINEKTKNSPTKKTKCATCGATYFFEDIEKCPYCGK